VNVSENQEGVHFIHLIERRALRQRIMEAVARAQEGSPQGNLDGPMTGALTVESRLRNFVKSFEAIEKSPQREPFDAIEAAFELGKFVAVVDIVTGKKIGRANTKIMRETKAKKRNGPGPVERAVRELMAADPTITGSEHHVPGIKPKIDAIVGKPATESTIWRYTKKVAKEKK